MAISSNDYLVLQQTISGQIRKTTVGNLLAEVDPGVQTLGELTDVNLALLQDEQMLVYNQGTGNWEPQNIPEGVDLTNYLQKPGATGIWLINEDGAGTITYQPFETVFQAQDIDGGEYAT